MSLTGGSAALTISDYTWTCCLDCLDLHYSKPARRTRKRGTEQQARARDPTVLGQKRAYTEFRTLIEHRTELIGVSPKLSLTSDIVRRVAGR